MVDWKRMALVAVFLGGGVAAGLGLGRALEPGGGLADAAPEAPGSFAGLEAFQEELAAVAERVSPSVVHITTQSSEQGDLYGGIGSGVVVSAQGHIITNQHVVESNGARQTLLVRLSDGRSFPARIVGTDSVTDLALLQIEPRGAALIPIRFADSDRVRVGHISLAVGSPFGLSHSVTFGTVSAKHRRALLAQPYQDYIQTDAAINPGNSGGALVNIKGELLGINTLIVSPTRGSDGVGLAIASNLVHQVSEQLMKHGRVIRGYLGIRPMDFDQPLVDAYRRVYGIGSLEELLKELGLKEPTGVFVNFVDPESPAGKAGLKERDVVLSFNGEPVSGQSDMFFKVAKVAPGTPVLLRVLRDKKERDLKVEVGERESIEPRARPR